MTSAFEQLFLDNLPRIERILASISRRHAFPEAEREEFAAWAKLRLVADDYAVLRKFEGRSTLSTYLTTVLANLFRDYRIHRWGKWRPSAEARRLGPVAVQLETLLARDGRSLAEAIAQLRGRLDVERPAEELERLATRLPQRARRRFEGEESLARLESAEGADDGVLDAERRALERQAEQALGRALAGLEPQVRLALKLRFADGLAVVEIAALLGEPVRPLYARLERSLGALRRALEAEGLDAARITGLVGWAGLDLRVDFGPPPESATRRPSNSLERSP